MPYLRRGRTKQLKTFGEFCEGFLAMILNICKNASRIDLVFDTCMRLQKLLVRWMTNNAHVQSQGITFMLSGMAQELQIILCQSLQNGEVGTLPELDNNIEEADVRLIPHAILAVLLLESA